MNTQGAQVGTVSLAYKNQKYKAKRGKEEEFSLKC